MGRTEHPGTRALVVDDSRAMRLLLLRQLAALGIEGRDAAGGEEALEILAVDHVDVLLVDWHMPGMTGPEVVRAARARPGGDRLRVLMVTSESELESMAAAIEAGADDFLIKPFTPDALADKLALLGIG